jgi:hypothetical protein
VTERFTFNIGPGDRLLWVLEKLELAASHLVPIHVRLERALLEMDAVWPRDLPDDLHEQLIRFAPQCDPAPRS